MSVGFVAAGATAVAGYAGAQSAKKAGQQQMAAGNNANALTQEQYNQTRSDNRPFLNNGTAANNILAGFLGISDAMPDKTYDQLMAELGPNYFDYGRITGKKYNHPEWAIPEINRILAEQEQRKAQTASMKESGQFGSLMKDFTKDDLENDAVYQSGFQFALDEGRKGLERQASATGGTQNGKTLKALTRFGANTANQFGNDAFNRFNTNKLNKYNMLSGQAGAGQAAVNQVSAAGQNAAQVVGQNVIGMGNARAASAIGQTNALANGIGGAFNMYQQNQLMNSMNSPGVSLPAWPAWNN